MKTKNYHHGKHGTHGKKTKTKRKKEEERDKDDLMLFGWIAFRYIYFSLSFFRVFRVFRGEMVLCGLPWSPAARALLEVISSRGC
jgi:hypothetical protein